MSTNIIVPSLGESVTEATIAKWYKKPGESVQTDELLLELETDKVTLEVNASTSGVIAEINKNEGDIVAVGEIVGAISEGETSSSVADASKKAQEDQDNTPTPPATEVSPASSGSNIIASPAAGKIARENNVDLNNVLASGKDGRITKGDVLNPQNQKPQNSHTQPTSNDKPVERVRMTRLRQRIAERLKESQNTAAILTTFNEIDMKNVIDMRNKYKETFEKKHGIKLGFMSFFVKAAIYALQEVPSVNAEIEGNEVIYKNFYDIGVAVGTEQGLVVPIVRDANTKNFAGIESNIAELGKKAREGKLSMEDMTGGTFTISNGGVYGSLLSTPIINPPQSGILGMHKTQERPVVVDGKIEIRPMMYIALSYDHRIIDGKEAVTFLVKVKEAIENPERLLLDL